MTPEFLAIVAGWIETSPFCKEAQREWWILQEEENVIFYPWPEREAVLDDDSYEPKFSVQVVWVRDPAHPHCWAIKTRNLKINYASEVSHGTDLLNYESEEYQNLLVPDNFDELEESLMRSVLPYLQNFQMAKEYPLEPPKDLV